jgi:hypothetical protein
MLLRPLLGKRAHCTGVERSERLLHGRGRQPVGAGHRVEEGALVDEVELEEARIERAAEQHLPLQRLFRARGVEEAAADEALGEALRHREGNFSLLLAEIPS